MPQNPLYGRRKHDSISSEIREFVHDEFLAHEERESERFCRTLGKAFPGGDLEGHRHFHEARIEAAKAEEEFWKVAKVEILKKGITGAVSLLGVLLVLAIIGALTKAGVPLAWLVAK